MKNLRLCSAVGAAALAAFAVIAGPSVMSGQDKAGKGKAKGPVAYKMPVKGEIPRTADGQPDLNGVWMRPYTPDMTKGNANASASTLNFTDWGKGKWEKYDASAGDYAGACLPFGLVRSINAPHPMQIVQSKNWVAFLHEQNTWFTKVPTDGRPFPPPAEMDPTWFGTSRGRWEGDTLIIDTIGIDESAWLERWAMPHTNRLHTIERVTRLDLNTLKYELTVDDPGAYTAQWTSGYTLRWTPNLETFEYVCQENNYGPQMMVGVEGGETRTSPVVP